jgi:hypothetical protein
MNQLSFKERAVESAWSGCTATFEWTLQFDHCEMLLRIAETHH